MKNKLMLTGIGLLTMSTLACATKEEKKDVEKRVQVESPVARDESLANRGANIFVDAKGITAEQKDQLLQIHAATFEKANTLRDELTKTKTALFRALVDPSVKTKEINLMKKKIVSLDRERLDVMMDAFAKVQKVVGREADKAVYGPFYRMENFSLDSPERR